MGTKGYPQSPAVPSSKRYGGGQSRSEIIKSIKDEGRVKVFKLLWLVWTWNRVNLCCWPLLQTWQNNPRRGPLTMYSIHNREHGYSIFLWYLNWLKGHSVKNRKLLVGKLTNPQVRFPVEVQTLMRDEKGCAPAHYQLFWSHSQLFCAPFSIILRACTFSIIFRFLQLARLGLNRHSDAEFVSNVGR